MVVTGFQTLMCWEECFLWGEEAEGRDSWSPRALSLHPAQSALLALSHLDLRDLKLLILSLSHWLHPWVLPSAVFLFSPLRSCIPPSFSLCPLYYWFPDLNFRFPVSRELQTVIWELNSFVYLTGTFDTTCPNPLVPVCSYKITLTEKWVLQWQRFLRVLTKTVT